MSQSLKDLRSHPGYPGAQRFNVTSRPGDKRGWSKTRGNNNGKKEGGK